MTGGGSGHLPLFLGYVGDGLLDGVAVGDVFASPSADQILQATRAVDGGAGVLYLYGNYGGDVMNFDLAAELAELEGITVRTVVGADDVASAPAGQEVLPPRHRRASCCSTRSPGRQPSAAQTSTRSFARPKHAASVPAHVRCRALAHDPALGRAGPRSSWPRGEMELGMGIHGEPGVHRGELETADAVADRMLDRGSAPTCRSPPAAAWSCWSTVSGATPLEELYVLYRRVRTRLTEGGISVHRSYVGEYVTSLEMAGASLSLLVVDDELAALIDAPARTPFFEQGVSWATR